MNEEGRKERGREGGRIGGREGEDTHTYHCYSQDDCLPHHVSVHNVITQCINAGLDWTGLEYWTR